MRCELRHTTRHSDWSSILVVQIVRPRPEIVLIGLKEILVYFEIGQNRRDEARILHLWFEASGASVNLAVDFAEMAQVWPFHSL